MEFRRCRFASSTHKSFVISDERNHPDFVANLCAKTNEIRAEGKWGKFSHRFFQPAKLGFVCERRLDECCWQGKVAKLEKPSRHFYFCYRNAQVRRGFAPASDSPMMMPPNRQRRRKNKNGHSFPLFPPRFFSPRYEIFAVELVAPLTFRFVSTLGPDPGDFDCSRSTSACTFH